MLSLFTSSEKYLHIEDLHIFLSLEQEYAVLMIKVTTSYWCNYVNPHVPSRGPWLTTCWETWHDITCYVDHCLRQILDTRPTRRLEHVALYFSLSWSLFWQIFVVISRIRWPIFPAFVSNVKIKIPSRLVWHWRSRRVYFVWGDRFESWLGHRWSWLKFFLWFPSVLSGKFIGNTSIWPRQVSSKVNSYLSFNGHLTVHVYVSNLCSDVK
jgi:hypothetical protein